MIASLAMAALAVLLGARCGGKAVSALPGDEPSKEAAPSLSAADALAKLVDQGPEALAAPYDPTAEAVRSRNQVSNPEAGIPAQCYTKTDGVSNPCWTCHTESRYPNLMSDWHLQKEYAFSEQGLQNHWLNLFDDRRAQADSISDDVMTRYIAQDNYTPLMRALAARPNYAGYRPDLDVAAGFDAVGFARDGSGWRAFRYKPFPGSFWPTNGATDDVMIRLPAAFRERRGRRNADVYKANLAILEASFASDAEVPDAQLSWPTERIDERSIGMDLDRDGRLRASSRLVGLPKAYLGDAAHIPVQRSLYPEGTEFLHTVRYVDPDAPNLMATRMKELRYAQKTHAVERWKIISNYEREMNEREEGKPPVVQGEPVTGLVNAFGWRLHGFIEDAEGRLRLQTHEEQLQCMGCHSNLGVTLDQTFSFPRKVPGAKGWGHQDLRGIPDVPQLGHAEGEILTYLRRVRGGDEFRSNAEMLARYFRDGEVDATEVRRAAPGGDRSIADLLAPSRQRALALNKAYWGIVQAQSFARGRDVVLAPATNVHRAIENGSTELAAKRLIYTDGQLRLDWRGAGVGL